jgi:cytochrome c oxidase assembly factor CtaG
MLWAWHAPLLYETALRSEIVHILEHLGLLGTALLFWWVIVHPRGSTSARAEFGILALFTMALQSGLLGALLTFAPEPWYAAYAFTTQAWGLTPLEDQQLAGGIMWIPVGTVYTLAALALFLVRLAGIERTARQREIQRMGEE